MRTIQLTRGKVALVDDEEYEGLNHHKWCAHTNGYTFYAVRTIKSKKLTIYMHRQIMNPTSGLEIDHIDGNGLNNLKSNLRIVTTRENQQNQHRNKSSKYPGVYWNKRDKYWQARFKYCGKLRHIGCSKVEEDAYAMYLVAVKFLC